MKNYIKILVLLFTLGLFWASCDKITFPYTTGGNGDNLTNDTVRKVLLEDFTGHTCVNCPQAHKIADDLEKLYGKQLVVVAIHAGFFSKPKAVPYDDDFRTNEGTDLYNFFGVQSAPIGMVNRIKQNNGGYLVDKGAFATEVSKQIDSLPIEPDLYIYLEPTFNTGDSTVNLQTDVTFLTNLPSGKYNLCVMITESGIIAAQKNNDPAMGNVPVIVDYQHNHMLRGMLTTTWGDEIMDGAPTDGLVVYKNYSNFKLGKDWNPKNCHIVAFVYLADGAHEKEIIQAQEVELMK